MSDYNDDKQEATNKLLSVNSDSSSDLSPEFTPSPALIEKFVIRLPNGLRKKIRHLSEQNRRSMNSEIIMVLEKHIQQHLLDHAAQLDESSMSMESLKDSSGTQKPADRELTKRLENLPEEKKQALLELLG